MKEPKIRFKGFQGEWEEKTLGKPSTRYVGGVCTAARPPDRNKK